MTQRFDAVASEWDKGDMRQVVAHKVFGTISSRIALNTTMSLMDFGAGTGLLSFKIAPLVHSMAGVDLASKMLEQLEAKNSAEASVKTVCQDIMTTPLESTFHGIVSSMALHHVQDTKALFTTFHTHLKKEGFVALADLEAEDGTFHSHGNEGVFHFGFEREALRAIMEEVGFDNVRFHHAHTVVKEERHYPIFVVTAIKRG